MYKKLHLNVVFKLKPVFVVYWYCKYFSKIISNYYWKKTHTFKKQIKFSQHLKNYHLSWAPKSVFQSKLFNSLTSKCCSCCCLLKPPQAEHRIVLRRWRTHLDVFPYLCRQVAAHSTVKGVQGHSEELAPPATGGQAGRSSAECLRPGNGAGWSWGRRRWGSLGDRRARRSQLGGRGQDTKC